MTNIKIFHILNPENYMTLLFKKRVEIRPHCIDAWNSRMTTMLTAEDYTYIFTLSGETVWDTKNMSDAI